MTQNSKSLERPGCIHHSKAMGANASKVLKCLSKPNSGPKEPVTLPQDSSNTQERSKYWLTVLDTPTLPKSSQSHRRTTVLKRPWPKSPGKVEGYIMTYLSSVLPAAQEGYILQMKGSVSDYSITRFLEEKDQNAPWDAISELL